MISKIPSGISSIFFDCDGTILKLKHSIGKEYGFVLEANGYKISTAKIDNSSKDVWKEWESEYLNEKGGFATTQDREFEFWILYAKEVVKRAGGESISDKVALAIYQHFKSPNTRVINPKIQELLTDLKREGYLLGIITNNDERTKTLLSMMPIGPFLDHVFTAGDLGWKKPSRNCFMKASEIINVPPKRILYIGDDLDMDIYPALSSGFHALWYNPKNDPPPPGIIDFQSFESLF